MRKALWLGLVAVLAGLAAITSVTGKVVEWLWLRELGFQLVFWRILFLQALLFAGAGAAGGIYLWANLRFALGRTQGSARVPVQHGVEVELTPARLRTAALVGSGLLGIFLGLTFAAQWQELLLFFWHQPVGRTDPLFGRDIGFYLFRLPFYERLQGGLTLVGGAGFVGVLAIYLFTGVPTPDGSPRPSLRRGVRHLAVTFLVFLAGWAWGYYLDRYQLLLTQNGAVFGAGYTAVHVLRYALWAMVGASALLAGAVLVGLFRTRLRPPLLGVAAYGVLILGLLWLWPGAVQKFVVEPNELEREEPYLARTIAHTRQAFDLDRVEARDYRALANLSYDQVRENTETLRNVRLWHWRPLLQTYRQMQEIRLYYHFYEVDVDRYRLPQGYRQVMLSARELGEKLPAQADTWVNRVLQFTHGYGLAMTLAAQEGESGTPPYLVKTCLRHPPRGWRWNSPRSTTGRECRATGSRAPGSTSSTTRRGTRTSTPATPAPAASHWIRSGRGSSSPGTWETSTS